MTPAITSDDGQYRLTIGFGEDDRQMAIITQGGHPQIIGSGDCTIVNITWVDEIPGEDIETWFKSQVIERPWETRQ